eukprot:scaffold7052_cov254-Pinguiococcus_pyrenoidosus.AAC.118
MWWATARRTSSSYRPCWTPWWRHWLVRLFFVLCMRRAAQPPFLPSCCTTQLSLCSPSRRASGESTGPQNVAGQPGHRTADAGRGRTAEIRASSRLFFVPKAPQNWTDTWEEM